MGPIMKKAFCWRCFFFRVDDFLRRYVFPFIVGFVAGVVYITIPTLMAVENIQRDFTCSVKDAQ